LCNTDKIKMSKRRALSIKLPREVRKPVLLYRLVFASFTMRFVALIMLGFFALQPVTLIYANQESKELEVVVASEQSINEAVKSISSDRDFIDSTTPEMTLDENTDSEVFDVESDNDFATDSEVLDVNDLSIIEATSSTEIVLIFDEVSTTSEESLGTTTTLEEIEQPKEVVTPEFEFVYVTNPSESNQEEVVETVSEVVDDVPASDIHNSNLNRYQFSESECVMVGDGSFYCSKTEIARDVGKTTNLEARLDEEGDSEIYLTINNEVIQLSDNQVDDASPKYDPLSESVVWHRLIDGRYQIVAYDLNTKTEVILSNNNVNNMEPDRSGKYTVWQRWVDDNWEIILFDGETEKQITNNQKHDVAPNVRGEYVIWHTNDGNGERKVGVYEIETGLISEIADPEGGIVQNPRFVLVYDTKFENGDVITKGYDFGSGEVVPLSAVPADLPDQLPSPDQTGETRALIQTKSTSREEGEVASDDLDYNPIASTTETAIDTETSTSTIDLSATPNDEIIELNEFDLVITPYEPVATSSTQASHSTSSENLVE